MYSCTPLQILTPDYISVSQFMKGATQIIIIVVVVVPR